MKRKYFAVMGIMICIGGLLGRASRTYTPGSAISTGKQTTLHPLRLGVQEELIASISGARASVVSINDASGIIITTGGLVLTSRHVVADTGASYEAVTSDGRRWVVSQIRLDPSDDIAILRIVDNDGKTPIGLQSASLVSDNEQIVPGSLVLTIGNVLGKYPQSVSVGAISALDRRIDTPIVQTGLYQLDMMINQGNSGGPLLDTHGHVIGIIMAKSMEGQGIGFALPVDQSLIAKKIADRDL